MNCIEKREGKIIEYSFNDFDFKDIAPTPFEDEVNLEFRCETKESDDIANHFVVRICLDEDQAFLMAEKIAKFVGSDIYWREVE